MESAAGKTADKKYGKKPVLSKSDKIKKDAVNGFFSEHKKAAARKPTIQKVKKSEQTRQSLWVFEAGNK